ncbi:MAG: LexA family protein, partial [Ruminococcus sp.]
IPVLGTVRAGYPSEAIENILDYEEISEEMARNGEYFALSVKGDSMEPRFTDGDVVIVRKQEDINNGDIAIIMVNGDEATIKKVQKFEGGINLIPSNPVYDVITYSNKDIIEKPVVCLGKVVELRAKF